MTYGQELRTLREGAGLTVSELARRLSKSPGFVSLVENGKRNPNPRTLDAWLTALGVGLEDRQAIYRDWAYRRIAALRVPGKKMAEQLLDPKRLARSLAEPEERPEEVERLIGERLAKAGVSHREIAAALLFVLSNPLAIVLARHFAALDSARQARFLEGVRMLLTDK